VLPRALAPADRDGAVRIAARPDAFTIDPAGPVGGRVLGSTFRRDHFLVRVDTELGPIEVACASPPVPDELVRLVVDPDAVVVVGA
jgi:hypothetical protein